MPKNAAIMASGNTGELAGDSAAAGCTLAALLCCADGAELMDEDTGTADTLETEEAWLLLTGASLEDMLSEAAAEEAGASPPQEQSKL
jgi:hypothetical protein